MRTDRMRRVTRLRVKVPGTACRPVPGSTDREAGAQTGLQEAMREQGGVSGALGLSDPSNWAESALDSPTSHGRGSQEWEVLHA